MLDEPGQKRTAGVAAILVVGLLAGFVLATAASGQEFSTVGTIADDNQAYALPVETTDERLRFTLTEGEESQTPSAQFAVYDPEDRFFGHFTLTGDENADVITDQPGAWVVFVTDATNADLSVQVETSGDDDQNSSQRLIELETTEERHEIASQDGGELDTKLGVRMHPRPAAVALEYSGQVEDLDATVVTDEGVVYKVTDGRTNTSADGAVAMEGDTRANPANLVSGVYRVSAEAAELNGTVALVEQTYDRAGLTVEQEGSSTEAETGENVSTLPDQGSLVAQLEEGEPVRISTQGASEVILALEDDSYAEVAVYGSDDRVIQQVELGSADRYEYEDCWCNGDDRDDASDPPAPPAPPEPPHPPEEENETGEHEEHEHNASEEAPGTIERLELAQHGELVLYASEIHGHGDEVFVVLPGVEDAKKGQPLEVVEHEVRFQQGMFSGEDNRTKNVTLEGGLLEVHVDNFDVASSDRNVTVTTRLGLAYSYEESFNSFGARSHVDVTQNVERFTDGDVTVATEGSGIEGETTVSLFAYEPAASE